ncbi:MAG: hypothetical protein AVDCRST_MAG64-1641 [uncultured Phycisphaerae bacterium]|uniref:Uncharacterized protein n=1 Tax=uncultured Phycisphaerae bacterium TaxID=904963 RepID=A0A6J4NZU1_9BACT|nr:MAG: hypothetical protein AVDCRST_MAG64-1641 [uncultured Phycisphaerae bacterium]
MRRTNQAIRFVLVLFLCACLLSLLARVMDDSRMGWWPVGAAVWGAAFALAAVDAWFRSREGVGGA